MRPETPAASPLPVDAPGTRDRIQPGTSPAAASRNLRLESVDVVRGIAMILMALDHVRDFFGNYALNPTDPATTTVALFFTRWITHFCAPVFFLLTGLGACLSLKRKTTGELSRFLLTRGLWLLVLEVTVVRCLGMQFNFDYRVTVLTVIWALGWSMMALAILVRFPTVVPAVVGVVLIVGHNLLDGIRPESLGLLAPAWTLLHTPGFLLASPEHTLLVGYPLIPWIGVTAVGFALGQWYGWSSVRRRGMLLRVGIACSVAFVVLRAVNVYGDPAPWGVQRSPVFTALAFLNTSKYPPSLAFLLMTLGPALCLLAILDSRTPRFLRPALTFGRVPLFYFLLHLSLIHGLAVIACYFRYGEAHWLFESSGLDQYPFTQPPGWDFGLPIVYLMWVVVVLALYPLCAWFAALKQRRRDPWLSYL